MTRDEYRQEQNKAFAAELGRATVMMIRKAAEMPWAARVDGATALRIFAESLEQSIEDRTL